MSALCDLLAQYTSKVGPYDVMTAAETREGKYGLTVALFYSKLEEHCRNSSGVARLEATTTLVKPTTTELCEMVEATILDTYAVHKKTPSSLVQSIEENLTQCKLERDEQFSWKHLQSLVGAVEPTLVSVLKQIHPAEETSTQTPSSLQLNLFTQRWDEEDFPPVRPIDLHDPMQQKAAEFILALVDSKDTVNIKAFISQARSQLRPPLEDIDQAMKTLYKHFYTDLLTWLLHKALQEENFPHRHHNGIFLPLIPPQMLESTEEQENASRVLETAPPFSVEVFDKELWSEWSGDKEMLSLMGRPVVDGFVGFLFREYYPILANLGRKLQLQQVIREIVPAIPYERFIENNQILLNERKTLLQKATETDSQLALEDTKCEIDTYAKTLSGSKQQFFQSVPLEQNKMAVDAYYKNLAHRVEKRNISFMTGQREQTGEEKQDIGIVKTSVPNVLHSLDDFIAGRADPCKVRIEAVERKCEYACVADIQCNIADNTLLNFQGVMIWCDEQAREAGNSNSSAYHSRKKARNNNGAQKVANLLLVDKTGPVQVIVWGDLASKITDHWNMLQAARASSTQSDVPHIVDFQKVRVFPLVKSDYNGESITRIRTLRTMENTGEPINATTMCFKTTPTTPNLLEMEWRLPPPNCCVCSFHTVKSKLRAPFRLTLKGIIQDVQPLDVTLQGNTKERAFYLPRV